MLLNFGLMNPSDGVRHIAGTVWLVLWWKGGRDSEQDSDREREQRLHSPFALNTPIY